MSRPLQGGHQVDSLRIGVVTARFNLEVTEKLEAGAVQALQKMGIPADAIRVARVPGAFEIPLAAQAFLEAGCHGVVALGAVIRGETSHYDYVCNAVERGCSEIALKYQRPVGFGVLTTDDEAQALERAGGRHGNKGAEAAEVTIEMINLLNLIKKT